jgi:hypothetical protein
MAADVVGTADDPVFTAVAGATVDNLVVTQTGADTVVFDDGAEVVNTAVVGCTANTPVAGDVTCVAPGGALNSIAVNLDGGNDSTTFSGVASGVVIQDGGDGADTLRGVDTGGATTMVGGAGADTFVPGTGLETVDYSGSATAVNATVGDGANDGAGEGDDLQAGIDAIVGSPGADTIGGGAGNNPNLDGGDGNDTINGGGGDDVIVAGGGGADDVQGGTGVDLVLYTGGDVNVSLDDIANDGAAGEGDNVHGDVDGIASDVGNDTLRGGPLANLFSSGDGDDSINALNGISDTVIDCGVGGDVVYADAGDIANITDTCEGASSAAALAFGSLATGSSSAAQTLTIRNTGAAPLALGTTAITGAFNTSADGCSNGTLAVGATCSVNVAFAPTALGANGGTLTIPTAGSDFVVALGGTGVAPAAAVTPPPAGTTPPPPPPPPPPAAPAVKLAAKSLSVKVQPARDRSKPYKFTVTGKLSRPAGVTAAKGCTGTVTVTYKKGTKTVATKKVSVRKDCTYSAKSTIRSKGKMKVGARFGGNAVLKAKSSAKANVRAG